MKTAFLGTSDFASTVLRRLASSPHSPSLVVTPPDRRRGRGLRAGPPPAAETARELGIELAQTGDVNEPASAARIRDAGPEAIVVCAFGQLIKEPLLGDFQMLNVHPSLLPRWRGAAPIERAIMVGDDRTGVSVMRITTGLDSGPVALQAEAPIEPGEDYGALSARLAAIGGELIVRGLDLHEEGELTFTDQDDSQATYAEKIEPGDRRLDPSRRASELAARVRALTPHIGAHLELVEGDSLGVKAAVAEEGDLREGELVVGDGLRLGCAEGVLRLEVVQPPGGRVMPVDAYLRGHRVPARAV